jgi:hypothetical protein
VSVWPSAETVFVVPFAVIEILSSAVSVVELLATSDEYQESVVAKLLTMTECVPAIVPVAAVAVTTLESELVADTVPRTPVELSSAVRSVLKVSASASSKFNAVV